MFHLAHIQESEDKTCAHLHYLIDHLRQVSVLAENAAKPLGLSASAKLVGLLHDLGKYSERFQKDRLRASYENSTYSEDEEQVDAAGRGEVDHATAGAQYLWQRMGPFMVSGLEYRARQILCLCIMSHHAPTGLNDCISPDLKRPFYCLNRIQKNDKDTNLQEALSKVDATILQDVDILIPQAIQEWVSLLTTLQGREPHAIVRTNQLAQIMRMFQACLINADHLDTIGFSDRIKGYEMNIQTPTWETLIERYNQRIAEFKVTSKVDEIRATLSQQCLEKSVAQPGLFTLTVPTGGGKTLASLRFALNHAKLHGMKRIIVVTPFTTIIDQNVNEVRPIFEKTDKERHRIVTEHHSNLMDQKKTWRTRVHGERWDTPLIYTTAVQFLNSMFGKGSKSVARMAMLQDSVIIFDEAQALPPKCIHLFNNAVQMLINHCHSTVVLCTATQPSLGAVDATRGNLPKGEEIISDVKALFTALKRVNVIDMGSKKMSPAEIADLAHKNVDEIGSCLVVCNTKKAAKAIYESCEAGQGVLLYHLSTDMCPAHRMAVLALIRLGLEDQRKGLIKGVICVSTQLIEAGVDVDFGSAIRILAGMDSVNQTAGRCNRNGKLMKDGVPIHGKVFLVRIDDEHEKLYSLTDILAGRGATEGVLSNFKTYGATRYDGDLISEATIKNYYNGFYSALCRNANHFSYVLDSEEKSSNPLTLLDFLSTNKVGVFNIDTPKEAPLRFSHRQAAEAFKVIDTLTTSVLVPYGAGKDIIGQLFGDVTPEEELKLLMSAKPYTVNLYDNVVTALKAVNALKETKDGNGIWTLDPQFYHEDIGVSEAKVCDISILSV